jgi:hypothetical protein
VTRGIIQDVFRDCEGAGTAPVTNYDEECKITAHISNIVYRATHTSEQKSMD